MCGICGFVGLEETGLIEAMMVALAHRGPDADGRWVEGNVALGHRRLSVIDLDGGGQPMTSADGSLVITFNGEIYNHRELREQLVRRGHAFRTESDTEVLLAMVREHGADALEKLNGMFAFGVWDRATRELFLARDRVGIKPLCYLELPGAILFASETSALLCHAGCPRELDAGALADYLALRYVPGDSGLLRGIKRLPAGHFLRYRDSKLEIRRWWSPPEGSVRPGRSEDDCVEELGQLLETSVRRRLMSDVPYGAYLSGGLDSSVVVALMSTMMADPLPTFTVGFGTDRDETDAAAATARALGCDHYVVECGPESIELLPEVVNHSDEPMGDAISLPAYLLAREAKQHVKVVVTGEGADEIFGGYLFHAVMWAASAYRRVVPRPISDWLIQPLLSMTPATILNLAFRYPARLGQRGKLKALDYVRTLGSGSLDEGYRHLISLFDARDTGSLFTSDFEALLREQRSRAVQPDLEGGSEFDRLLRLQFAHWLPDNMLQRQDRMSMASGIEARVPYLDHELIEFAFGLQRNLRLRRLVGKYALRKLGRRLLPVETASRPKRPFYVPLESYFEQPRFQQMMDDLLSDEAVESRKIFRIDAVRALRDSMSEGEFVPVKQVFSLMTLELWFRSFLDRPPAR